MTTPLSPDQRVELVAKAKAAGIGGYVQFVPASTILSYEATVQALTVERDAALEGVKACVRYLGPGRYQYGEWSISYDPPPIPVRTQDWSFTHRDYDASYEGPEDGWVSNGLGGRAASLDEAITEINERKAEADD
jgi:hypothetical protein